MDERVDEASVHAMRSLLDIEQEDPEIFHPVDLDEAIRIARIIRADVQLSLEVRRLAEVGITLDLMPNHLRPSRRALGRAVGCSGRTVLRREVRWEGIEPLTRFELARRALRLLIAYRARERDCGR
jgi:hypothetical protein